ncbi:hypothetical protein M406DRAFT_356769 [Cryphonectria parasitica EP155]|uniref:Uncharacterized protein n=1 Tax=Cryphonectria parasitica (strain ATCC 38755 / EP155) TaxID=660469 RepID=A0A9P4Y233_CRYP1|nr:uncharacterized protein M406DRAFT_356769 [Cryphonectria parasitica EP155]KAF3765025.1 hypothetical protein M406DRAFT_356769 [Cryphonectria parasitica EP155]
MAVQLKTTGSSSKQSTTRWRGILLSTILVALLFVGLYSQPLFFDEDGLDQKPISKKLHTNQAVFDPSHGRDRPLILYAYAESDNARENLEFFVKRGLHARADFIFIFNGETDAVGMIPTNLENVKIVQRENTCYDIGAFGQVLAKDGLWMKYKRFITLNASIRGPFLPVWSDECWTDAFLNKLSDTVKLVGLSYHCVPSPHVQSMLLATDRVGMKILLDPTYAYSVPLDTPPWGGAELPVGYSVCYSDYAQAVHAEIGMARLIRSQGFEVDVMLTSVHAYTPKEYCEVLGPQSDHLGAGNYFGSNVHPYELIFAKANRGIDDALLDHLTEWHYTMNDTSWDKCGRDRP